MFVIRIKNEWEFIPKHQSYFGDSVVEIPIL